MVRGGFYLLLKEVLKASESRESFHQGTRFCGSL